MRAYLSHNLSIQKPAQEGLIAQEKPAGEIDEALEILLFKKIQKHAIGENELEKI